MLHNVLTRPGFTGAEVQFLRGVVRSLVEPRNKNGRNLAEPRRRDTP
jgi:tRNA/rRNA methyltransferase